MAFSCSKLEADFRARNIACEWKIARSSFFHISPSTLRTPPSTFMPPQNPPETTDFPTTMQNRKLRTKSLLPRDHCRLSHLISNRPLLYSWNREIGKPGESMIPNSHSFKSANNLISALRWIRESKNRNFILFTMDKRGKKAAIKNSRVKKEKKRERNKKKQD